MKTRSFAERLSEKSAQALLTNHFRERYNYNPAMAEAIFKDAVFVRTLLEPTAREDGQVILLNEIGNNRIWVVFLNS
jgi:hypothetical protein